MRLYTTIILFCIMITFSFWLGNKNGLQNGLQQCLDCQEKCLSYQADLKRSLDNQINYIKFRNQAHEKVVAMEAEKENNRAKETLKVEMAKEEMEQE